MRQFSLILVLLFGATVAGFAQANVDITKVLADPNTRVFDDGKHTVNSYLYSVMESSSTCCGNDAIYLEVKIDEQGYVSQAKTLTGRNECYRKSVTDAIKNVRWIHEDIRGTRTIYFEVKPVIPCSGVANENEYSPIEISNNPYFGSGEVVADNSGSSNNDLMSDNVEETVEDAVDEGEETAENLMDEGEETTGNLMDEGEEVVADVEESWTDTEEVVEETVEEGEEMANNVEETGNDMMEDEGFLTEETTSGGLKNNNTSEENGGLKNTWTDNSESTTSTSGGLKNSNTVATNRTAGSSSSNRSSGGKIKIPPQADKPYNPVDHKPNEQHNTTFVNNDPATAGKKTSFQDQDGAALEIKKGLRAKGVCGLAKVFAEVTVDPQGNVVDQRVIQTNSDEISQHLPALLGGLKMAPRNIQYNYPVLVQFMTNITCEEGAEPVDLKSENFYLNTEGVD